jgi:hypothetical protein
MTKQHDLDLATRKPRVKPAHERVIDLLQSEGTCSRWVIMSRLNVRSVSGHVARANHTLAPLGLRIENLSGPGEVGRYRICEDRTSSERSEG